MSWTIQDPTHLIFDDNGKKVIISENVAPIFFFLMDIEQEIDFMLGQQDKLSEINRKLIDIIDDFKEMSKILIDNGFNFKYTCTTETLTIVDDVKRTQTLRTQMISLFAYMETIFCLVTIYDKETDNKKKIIKATKQNVENLISSFILTPTNPYYKEHADRFKKINAEDVKALRNSLTHFFGVCDKIWLLPKEASKQGREAERFFSSQQLESIFISPQDFHMLLKEAVRLILMKRNDETVDHPGDFKRKMQFVMNIVEEIAPKLVTMKQWHSDL